MSLPLDWLSLKAVPGVGNRLFLNLFRHFGSPANVFSASPQELIKVGGVTERMARLMAKWETPQNIYKDIEQVQRAGAQILTFSHADYPKLLRHIHDPPPVLYVRGSLDANSLNMAVVGSRNATIYGRRVTRRLSADLVQRGFTVVSGMAAGIDTAAHEGALSARGKTTAVLGCGLGRIYPAENRKLFHEIAEKGAVISEFSWTTPPEAHNFPTRNRIISGMSLGAVIVEATQKSGSLITARLAAEQGREVFAVPGSIQSFKSMGTHHLIKQGAKLVEQVNDIVEELNLAQPPLARKAEQEAASDLTSHERMVLHQLSPYPVHIDTLIQRLSLSPAQVSGLLLQLELKGLVTQSPGKLFSSCES